jgi:LPS sulfotransferase NodH
MPRSGTAFLAGLLASTRRVPFAREYFNRELEPEWARDDYARYVARTVAASSRRGTFGAKFVHYQLTAFVATLRSLPENGALSDRALLESVFPTPRYIWVERRDVVAQAVSWLKAQETGDWWLSPRPWARAKPVAGGFDFDEVERRVAEIVRGNGAWERWFAEHELEPLRVVYEELDTNPADVTRSVLAFLHADVPPRLRVKARSARQSDALNADWIARYHALASARPDAARA